MAAAFVQGTGVQSVGNASSVSKAFASNVVSGNVLVAHGNTFTTNHGADPHSDSQTNDYTRRAYAGDAASPTTSISTASAGSSAACTVTFTVADANDWPSIGIWEISGGTYDVAGTANGSSTTPSVSLATNGAGLTVGGMTHNGASTRTMTPGTDYTQVFEDENADEMPINTERRTTNHSGGTVAVNWTMNGTDAWSCAAVSIKDDAGGAGTALKDVIGCGVVPRAR